MWRLGNRMYEVVGHIGAYIFVVDTSDNLCKMVLKRSLNGVDLNQATSQSLQISKLRMLYKLNQCDDYFYRRLIVYKLTLLNKKDCVYREVTVEMSLNISDSKAFVNIILSSKYTISSSILRPLDLYNGKHWGIVVPTEMVYYLLRLSDNCEWDLILQAFSGVFSNKLLFIDSKDIIYSVVSVSGAWRSA